MTRPRIADDFVVIRARIEEMRRERAQASAEQDGRSVTGPPVVPEGISSDPRFVGPGVRLFVPSRWPLLIDHPIALLSHGTESCPGPFSAREDG